MDLSALSGLPGGLPEAPGGERWGAPPGGAGCGRLRADELLRAGASALESEGVRGGAVKARPSAIENYKHAGVVWLGLNWSDLHTVRRVPRHVDDNLVFDRKEFLLRLSLQSLHIAVL